MSAAAPAAGALLTGAVTTAAEDNDHPQFNRKKGFNAAAKKRTKNPNLFHLLLIRHAESSNNVLAEQITHELGINPYGPNSGEEVMALYDKRRVPDPDLSELGYKQAELLPLHPHLHDVNFPQLVREKRVQFVTSPMQRAIITSRPLLKSVANLSDPPLRATLVHDICEKGGNYVTSRDAQGKHVNRAEKGATRAQLQERWGDTHDASNISEDGWWAAPSPGQEEDGPYEERLGRAVKWVHGEAAKYAADSSLPDFLVCVSHADFIDSLLTKLLRLGSPAKYVFYSSNTAISHLEFEVKSEEGLPPGQVVRCRGTNIKPVDVDTHELKINRKQH